MSFISWLRDTFTNYTDQYNPDQYGVIRIYCGQKGGDFPTYMTDLFEKAMITLHCLGPKFIRTYDPKNAHIIVRHWDSNPNKNDVQGAGQFTSPNLVEIDPTGCAGAMEVMTVFGHEVCHFLGMKHIKQDRLDPEHDSYSPVGVGRAMMNPCVNKNGNPEIPMAGADGLVKSYEGTLPASRPTKLDVKEFNRVWELTHSMPRA